MTVQDALRMVLGWSLQKSWSANGVWLGCTYCGEGTHSEGEAVPHHEGCPYVVAKAALDLWDEEH